MFDCLVVNTPRPGSVTTRSGYHGLNLKFPKKKSLKKENLQSLQLSCGYSSPSLLIPVTFLYLKLVYLNELNLLCLTTNILSDVDCEAKATARPSREEQQDLGNHAGGFDDLKNPDAIGPNGNAGIVKPGK